MPVIRLEEYACNVLWLHLVKDLWAILQEEKCREQLVTTSEAALWLRILKMTAFFNIKVLHILVWVDVTHMRATG